MSRISFKSNSEINVLYFSDVHGKTNHLKYFKTASDEFDEENKNKPAFKLASGDLTMDNAIKPIILIVKLMNLIGLDATCMGNHDLEGGNFWGKALQKVKPKFKILSANLDFSRTNNIEGKITKSTVIKKKGEKIGVIGVSPLDFGELTFINPNNNFITVKKIDETVKSVRHEVEKLEKQGINKIVLLAHTGKYSKNADEYYEKLSGIGGIDVIIGGHDHVERDTWYLSERNDPVKLISVGRAVDKDIQGEDLDSFGKLKAVFDENGVLVPEKCKNKVIITDAYPFSQEILDLEEKFLETKKVVAHSDRDFFCRKRGTEENPTASLAADAMLWVINRETKGKKAQIAFVNSGTVRGDIPKGDITIGSIMQALPFTSSTLIKAELTKKQIFDTLNYCAESTAKPKVMPGLMQVGGIRYTIGKDLKVKDVYLLNKDGSKGEKLDEAYDNKKYTVAYDIFLMTGVAGLSELKKNPKRNKNIEYYPYSRQDAVIMYFQHNFKNKPVELKTKRIEKD